MLQDKGWCAVGWECANISFPGGGTFPVLLQLDKMGSFPGFISIMILMMDFRLLSIPGLVPGKYFMAVAADRELGMMTPLCLTWTAGSVLLQSAGLLLEILQLSTEGWLLSAKSVISYLFYLKTQMGITLDHSQNLSGFGGSDLQVKGFVPCAVPGGVGDIELQPHIFCSNYCFRSQVCSSSVCPLCHTAAFHTTFFEASKAASMVLSSLTFFPNCCGLCKALPSGGSAHQLLSEITSWNTDHGSSPFPASLFFCSYNLLICDLVPWGRILVTPCPKRGEQWGQTHM